MAIGICVGLLTGPFMALARVRVSEMVLVSVLLSLCHGPPPYFRPSGRALRSTVIRAVLVGGTIFVISLSAFGARLLFG